MASTGQLPPSNPAQGARSRESPLIRVKMFSSSAITQILIDFLIYCGRAMLIFYPVYLTGYLGLSISWVLLCMFVLTYWKKNGQWKDARIGSAMELADNPLVSLTLCFVFSQKVQYTDVENVQWLNKVLEQAWPFIGMYMEKLLREKIHPSIRASNPALKAFTFTKIHFGYKPLKITGIRAYTHEVEHREVILDMNIRLVQGMLRVILEPLIGQAPLVGGVTLFFIHCPTGDLSRVYPTSCPVPGGIDYSPSPLNWISGRRQMDGWIQG
uniref:Extended synaptotagmin-like protein 3 n=1 Tax=Neolamprologus brichardi TaxID=32507 RepID=A0A3Q4HFK0_NEOBR